MGDEVVRLVAPATGTDFGTNQEFTLEAMFQFPPDFTQGSGLWQGRQRGPWFNLDQTTLIQCLTQNPFPVSGQDTSAMGDGKTTNYKGKLDLRIMVLNDQMQEYAVSNVVNVTVGMGEVVVDGQKSVHRT